MTGHRVVWQTSTNVSDKHAVSNASGKETLKDAGGSKITLCCQNLHPHKILLKYTINTTVLMFINSLHKVDRYSPGHFISCHF
jgi:hypothetical protein